MQQHGVERRKNISAACAICRSAKVKCDGGNPCLRCAEKGHTHCEYPQGQDRRTTLGREEKAKEMSRKSQVLDILLQQISQADDYDASELLALLRTTTSVDQLMNNLQAWQSQGQPQMPFTTTTPSIPSSFDSDKSDTDSTVRTRTREGFRPSHPHLGASLDTLSVSDLDEGQRRSAPDSVFHTRRYRQREETLSDKYPYAFSTSVLPPEFTIRLAARFFFSDIAGLFFVMSEQDFDSLATAVFTTEEMPNLLALTEICAIAAVGSQYHPDHIPDALKEAFFRTALQHIDRLLDTSYMRSMRTLACLGAYGIIEKRLSSRSLLHLGLQLSRWTVTTQQQQWTTLFSRLWRTFAFLDCWLSTSLGYESDLADSEINAILLSSQPPLPGDESEELTQQKMSEVAIRRLQITRQVAASELTDTAGIENGMASLTLWYQSVPERMSLANLVQGRTEKMTWGQQGALFLSHTMYLGAVVLLHRSAVLVAAAHRLRDLSAIHISNVPPMQEFEARSVDAARSMVRIFVLLGFDTERASLPMRCWLSLHEIFVACIMLLYGTTIGIISSSADSTWAREDLRRVETCLEMMKSSANLDELSLQMYITVSSIHESVNALLVAEDPREHYSKILIDVRATVTNNSM